MDHFHLVTSTRLRGAVALEFAFVAPLFVAFIFGIVETGRMTSVSTTATLCARAGAREAALATSTATSTQAAAFNCLAGAGISGASTVLSPADPAAVAVGGKVSVSISFPFSSVSWLGLMFQSKSIGASCAMCKQR